MKELPRLLISFEPSQIRLDKFRAPLFVRIDAGSICLSRFIRFQPSRLHSVFLDQPFCVANVHCAPNAAGFPRRKANHVTVFIDTLAKAIDPTKAQRFINRLRPGDARLAGVLFVEADPKLLRFRMIGGEPFVKGVRCFEEFDRHTDGNRPARRGFSLRRSRMFIVPSYSKST